MPDQPNSTPEEQASIASDPQGGEERQERQGESDAVQDAGVDAGESAKDWASMSASEKASHAAKARWARERERAARETSEKKSDTATSTAFDPDLIKQTLRRKAGEGDVHAARELRAWLDRYPEEDERPTLDALSTEQLERALQWVIEGLGDDWPADRRIP